jgi:hypothetical protein
MRVRGAAIPEHLEVAARGRDEARAAPASEVIAGGGIGAAS